MEKNTYKTDLQKMWKKLVIAARFALGQHFTNCSQQSYTTDFTADATKRNQKTKEDSRRSYQTLDHLATYKLLEQKCREWSTKMCVATMDLMKIFDFTSHQSLWKALEKCGNESNYIILLKRPYA